MEALTAADVCAAWVVWNNLLPALLSQRLIPEARSQLFGDPGTVYGNSTRAQGELAIDGGGYRLSGRWSLVSGASAATHMMLLGVVTDAGVPREVAPGVVDRRLAFVPATSVDVIHTWFAHGLRGTGSDDVVADDVWVPAAHTCGLVGPAPGASGRLDRMPVMCLMTAGGASMVLAMASACVGEVVSIASSAIPTDGRPPVLARPALAQGVARATADVRAARDAVRSALSALCAAADIGDVPGDARAAVMEAVDLARRLGLGAIRSAYELGGTASVYTSRTLERAHRDAHVMCQHIMFDPMWIEQAGRVRLGLAPTNPLF